MPALLRNPIGTFGKRTVTTAGTPVTLFTTTEVPVAAAGIWPARVCRVLIQAMNTNTGLIYIGTTGMSVTNLTGIVGMIAAPNSSASAVYGLEFPILAPGANYYRLQDYWIDAAVSGEGVIRTVWVA